MCNKGHPNSTRIDFNFYFYNGHEHSYKVYYTSNPVVRSITGFSPFIFIDLKFDIPINAETYLVELADPIGKAMTICSVVYKKISGCHQGVREERLSVVCLGIIGGGLFQEIN